MTASEGPREAGEAAPNLAEILLSDVDLLDTLQMVVRVATRRIPGVHEASVSLQTDQRLATVSASSSGIRDVDEAQYGTRRGPCVEAIDTGDEVAGNLGDGRWPGFEERATERGIRSVWSLPLPMAGGHPGALNLFSRDLDAWGPDDGDEARALAAQAAVVLTNAQAFDRLRQANAHLTTALTTRTIIGQAQGVLIGAEGITADEAFDVLRRASQRENRKVHDLAADIIARAQRRTD